MKLKKEQILLRLKKKFYLLYPLSWVGQPPIPKGAYSKHLVAWNNHSLLFIIPSVSQINVKKRIVSSCTWLLPLTETTPRAGKVRLWNKNGKGSRPGSHNSNSFWLYLRYKPQEKNAALLLMLRMHLKQLKIFIHSINIVFTTVLLTSIVPNYFPLERNLLPPGRNLGSQTLRVESGIGVRDKDNLNSRILDWSFVQKRIVPTRTLSINLIPLTRFYSIKTKCLWGKRVNSSHAGSMISKVNLPKVISSKKKNLLKGKKVVYTQKDLVKKISHFINIWCYLQMLFFFFYTLKQPMVVLGYLKLGYRTLKSLNGTTYCLSSNMCFLVSVKNFGRYPWRKQCSRVLIPTRIPVDSSASKKVQIWTLSSLSQLHLGYLKSWIPYLEERVSESSLSRVRKTSLPSHMSKEKSSTSILSKKKLTKLQTKNFYKYLSFCDYIIFKMVWKLCSRKHSNQSAQWIRCHYFYKLNGQSWVFALKKISFNPPMSSTNRPKPI